MQLEGSVAGVPGGAAVHSVRNARGGVSVGHGIVAASERCEHLGVAADAVNILGGKIFLGAVLGFFLIQMVLRIRVATVGDSFVVGGIADGGLHVRFLLLFVPFFAPLFANVLARWMPAYEPRKDKFVLNGF